ncbi:MAG: sodium:solute symporter [Saprospiraceae bacterium]|nr:sodium:solute symporter [Bacteroidia bacterium]NNE14039.1 sodium:solute symporter [Saprospiraceae bacterium]NNL92786.1 sodium:solute symporter [Saprospiraceae bacterium]
MLLIDWLVLIVTVVVIVGYGIWKTKGSQNIEGYLLGGNEAKWWTVGLSVMATQASAITFLSTPGQAYHDGMGFAQFYLMLPVAMIIICVTFIPLYYKLKVYTAYEFLESRFDLKTRSFTAGLFLLQRGLACGITIYAPAIILSSVMHWDLNITTVVIGLISVLYTMTGGTKAVHVTHKHQMVIILISLFIIFFILINLITKDYSLSENLLIAKANAKLQVIDFEFNLNKRYNIWSSLAAIFLFLSYFGTDQSQVQRYISGRSIKESRLGLIMNGIMKVPLQFFILFLGVLVFLFYQTNQAPIFFNQQVVDRIEISDQSGKFQNLKDEYTLLIDKRADANEALVLAHRANDSDLKQEKMEAVLAIHNDEVGIRTQVRALVKEVDEKLESNDKDYVFISFILKYLPNGLIGLLLAVVFFAAMSSTSSELNALASTTTVDIYKRSVKKDGSETHYLRASKMLTLFWGTFAILFASYGTLYENLIQFVNIIGSIFYGTILGIFLVAFYFKKIGGNTVFYSGVIVQIGVFVIYKLDVVPFLWLNLIGALGVIILSHILMMFLKEKSKSIG